MKKFFTLIAAALFSVGMSAQETVSGLSAYKTTEATLVHTAASFKASGVASDSYTSDIDAVNEYINNGAMTEAGVWQGCAYADFSFFVPEGLSVTGAELKWYGVGSGKNRTTDVFYVNNPSTMDYSEETGFAKGNAIINLDATSITTVTFPASATTMFTTDVTGAVKAMLEGGYSNVVFKFTNNVGSGNLVGKGNADNAPVLVIKIASAGTGLFHTAASFKASGVASDSYTSDIDAENEYINNGAMTEAGVWQGCAYADFEFFVPEGLSVTGAELKWYGVGSGKNRTTDVFYVNNPSTMDYSEETGFAKGNAIINLDATSITTVTFPASATTMFTTDVTDAVKTMIEGGYSNVVFKFTNNVGSGNLVGKGNADYAPVLTLTTTAAATSNYYIVRELDAENQIDTITYKGVIVGSEAAVSDEDIAPFYKDGVKYVYDENQNVAAIEVDADDTNNYIHVKFQEADKISYSVSNSFGDILEEGESYVGDEVTYYYPRFVFVEGSLYEAPANNRMYRNSFVPTEENNSAVVEYSATDYDNIAFFAEAEHLGTESSEGNADIRCSMGKGAYFAEDTYATTLQNGTYKVYGTVWGNSGVDFSVKAGEETVWSASTAGYIVDAFDANEFTVKGESDIVIPAAGTNVKVMDFLFIQRTGDYNYLDVNDSDLSDTITVKYGEDEFPDLCNDYVSVETNSMSVSKKLGLAKVLAGIDKKEVEYNMLGSMDDVLAFTTQSGPGIYYAFVNIEAQFDDNTNMSYVSDTIVINVVESNYLIIDSSLPDTITYTKGDPDMPQLSDYYTYESSQKDESKFTATMGLVKVEPGTAKDAVEYNIYDSEMAVKMAFVQGGVGTYYAFGKVTVEYDDQTTETVTTDTIVIEIKEKEAEPIVSTHTWNFTQFSETTVANLIADAAESKTSGWSDVEKKADAEAGVDPTELSKDNCFWFADNANVDGYLTANGQVIEELEGLVFQNETYNKNRSLAIAVNYGTIDTSKDFGPYHGGSYLWLGGKNFDAFTIKNVKAGSEIKMGVESHKITDARGVKLSINIGSERITLTAPDGSAVDAPKTYTEQTWLVPNAAVAVGAKGGSLSVNADNVEVYDVTVTNTNGCHIYWIDAEIEENATAIEAVSEDASNAGAKKIFENGKIVILNGATKYNTAGAQVK